MIQSEITCPSFSGIQRQELWDYFEIIIGGDTLAKKKPEPLSLLHGAKALDCDPTKSLMIGHSLHEFLKI